MSEKLIIKNFGTIREAELDLKRVMLFTGTPAGQSVLARLIAIFRDLKFLKREEAELNFFRRFNIHNFFEHDTYLNYQSGKHRVIYKDGKFSSSAGSENNGTLTEPELKAEEINALKDELTIMRDKFTADSSPEEKKKLLTDLENLLHRLKSVETKVERVEEAMSMAKYPVYFPAERALIGSVSNTLGEFMNYIPVPEIIREFAARFEVARQTVGALRLVGFDAVYSFENEDDRVYLTADTSINLSESSADLQAVIPLQLVLAYLYTQQTPLQSWIVGNIELNLSPPAQKHLIDYLIAQANNSGNELLLTTNSPYILSSLNNLLFGYQVVRNNGAMAEAVGEVIPREQWLNPLEFGAFMIEEGGVRSIVAENTGLLNENELNRVLEHIVGERNKLINILNS